MYLVTISLDNRTVVHRFAHFEDAVMAYNENLKLWRKDQVEIWRGIDM